MSQGLVALFCCCSLKVVVSSLGDEFKQGHFTHHILLLQQVRGPGYSRCCLHLLPSKLGKTKVSWEQILYCYVNKSGPGRAPLLCLVVSVCYKQRWMLFHGWICKHLKEHSSPSFGEHGHSFITLQYSALCKLHNPKIPHSWPAYMLLINVNHAYSCLLDEATVHNHENDECCVTLPCLDDHMVPSYWRSTSIVMWENVLCSSFFSSCWPITIMVVLTLERL